MGPRAARVAALVVALSWLAACAPGRSAPLARVATRPTPADRTGYPLGQPPFVADVGPYAFGARQADGAGPVAYDPCVPVRVVVNARTAPRNGARLVEQALALVADATGLRIEVEGPTGERPSRTRPSVQPRYGDRWAPVLVAWSDPSETPSLAGDVAGVAGSASVRVPGQPAAYVTGSVVLDGPQLGTIVDTLARGWARARAVVLHELGHLLGLAHVEDPSQLMARRPRWDVVALQPGDRAGLARLGRGPCVPSL